MHSISLSKLDTGPSVANHSVYGKGGVYQTLFSILSTQHVG